MMTMKLVLFTLVRSGYRDPQRTLSGLESGQNQATRGDTERCQRMKQDDISMEANNLTKVYTIAEARR